MRYEDRIGRDRLDALMIREGHDVVLLHREERKQEKKTGDGPEIVCLACSEARG